MMKRYGCQEIELETEVSNVGATQLYLKLGFIKDFRLSRYYLNGGDAFRLRLDLRENLKQLRQVLSAFILLCFPFMSLIVVLSVECY